MKYDYSVLLAKIGEVFVEICEFARAMSLSEEAILQKLRGDADWKQSEISDALRLLEIPDNKINQYFFATNVQRH